MMEGWIFGGLCLVLLVVEKLDLQMKLSKLAKAWIDRGTKEADK